jgi:hypothetical protein
VPGHRVESRATLTAVAPPRLRYVMPAVVPGWDTFLQVPPPSFRSRIPARSSFSRFPLSR